jgi:hypothetical protein
MDGDSQTVREVPMNHSPSLLFFLCCFSATLSLAPRPARAGKENPTSGTGPSAATAPSTEAVSSAALQADRRARLEKSIPANRGVARALFATSPILLTAGIGMIVVLEVYDRGPFTLLATVGRAVWGFFGVAIIVMGVAAFITGAALFHKAARYQTELDRLDAPPHPPDQPSRTTLAGPMPSVPSPGFSF